jgi:hypothetical protein
MNQQKDARTVDLRHVVAVAREKLHEGQAATRLHLRHGNGCYRWTGDGRCVDCQRYTGTPADAMRRFVDGGVEYHQPRSNRHRTIYERLVGA